MEKNGVVYCFVSFFSLSFFSAFFLAAGETFAAGSLSSGALHPDTVFRFPLAPLAESLIYYEVLMLRDDSRVSEKSYRR